MHSIIPKQCKEETCQSLSVDVNPFHFPPNHANGTPRAAAPASTFSTMEGVNPIKSNWTLDQAGEYLRLSGQ